MIYGLVNNP